jgi:hypothetical protein
VFTAAILCHQKKTAKNGASVFLLAGGIITAQSLLALGLKAVPGKTISAIFVMPDK